MSVMLTVLHAVLLSIASSLLQLEQVLLPGVEGYFGVKANHVPIIAQLQPGVVELHDGADVTKYFVSGGFAFVHPNSVTDVCVLEAATLDQFDSTAVKQALQVIRQLAQRPWQEQHQVLIESYAEAVHRFQQTHHEGTLS